MSYCQDGSGRKHVGVLAWSGETLIPRLPFSLFPETKVHFFLFGSRSRKGQRVPQSISISCLLSCPVSGEQNLGWPRHLSGVLLGREKEGGVSENNLSATNCLYPLTYLHCNAGWRTLFPSKTQECYI